MDEDLTDHEDVIGLRPVDTIDANCLAGAIKDVLLRMNLKLSGCRGQCYDGASNMTGSKQGVATQLQSEEPRAVLTHCFGHALNLAIGDAVKQSKLCQDALDVACEISKLIRYSPLTVATLKQMRSDESFGLFYKLVDTKRQKTDVLCLAKEKPPASLKLVAVMVFTALLLRTTTATSILKPSMQPFLASLIDSISQVTQFTETWKNCLLMQQEGRTMTSSMERWCRSTRMI